MLGRRGAGWALVACGIGLVATQAAVAALSTAFVFGEGHAERPILQFLAVEAVAVVLYLAAVEVVRRAEPSGLHLAVVLLVGLACRAVLAPAEMIQEVDAYRYVWDGQAVVQGANPYVLAPQEAHASGAPPAGSPSAEGRFVYDRISYRDVSTIYPPAAQALFAASQLLSPWGLSGWRLLLFLAEAATVVLLVLTLAKLTRPLAWVVVFAWSPLALKEFSNSLHLDAFVVFGLAAFVYAVVQGRVLLAFVALAWATLLKLFALALVPVLGAYAWRRSPRAASWGLVAFGAAVLLAYAPFLDAGMQLFAGLFAFARGWQRNDSLFTIVSWFAGEWARAICGAAMALTAAGATWAVVRAPSTHRLLVASLVVVVAIFLLAPTSNPWYFTWTLPFLVLVPSRALLLLSGSLLLYYADFHFLYRDDPAGFDLVRLVEYVPFYVALAWELSRARLSDLAPAASGMPD